jgi:hypothetical protein
MESPLLLALALGATTAAPAQPAIAAALVVAACTVRPEAVLLGARLLPIVVLELWLGLRRLRTNPIIAFGLMIVASYLVARPLTASWYFYLPLTVWAIAFGLAMERISLRLRVDSAGTSSLV